MKDTLTFEVYYSGFIRRSWKWKAITPNGKIIASGRGFNTETNARVSIETLMNYNDDYKINLMK